MAKKKKKETKAQIKKRVQRRRNKAIKLAMEASKIRDGWICQKCGNSKSNGFQIQSSHVLPQRMYPDLASNLDNIKSLCGGCHNFWWHLSPAEAGLWFIHQFPDRWKRLELAMRKDKSCPLDLQKWNLEIEFLEEYIMKRRDDD